MKRLIRLNVHDLLTLRLTEILFSDNNKIKLSALNLYLINCNFVIVYLSIFNHSIILKELLV